ncbi:MAG: PrsW family intramembrane metalloprotease [Propionibacteriaceae bacterium]|jgi:RsiW-degrading membrane proteinase PrsW (M82 family)|nr:PrsW family intramembrane metalloprotease [Propionibacteriaceae bacterium]
MSLASTVPPRIQAHQRRRAAVPQSAAEPWWRRWANPWLPLGSALVAIEVWSLAWIYRTLTVGQEQPDGSVVPGFNLDAIWLAAKYAWPTLAVLALIFIAFDRFRPQRLPLWLLALTWGGSTACAGALFLNEWASSRLAVMGWEPGYSTARLAVFIAPFVEEAMKAVILFVIVWADRGRIVSRLSGISLAGLSAVGFAFTENIIYYGQVVVYGSQTASAGDVQSWLRQFALQRGLYFCFGHPLFTAMTGIGLAVAVRHRSKIVRVVAPLVGYLTAAGLHMGFNTAVTAELVPSENLGLIYLLAMMPAVLVLILFVRFTLGRQRRLIASRLTDYVVMGWLPTSYPDLFAKWWTRTKALLISPWHGNVIATVRLQSAVTELAYLRDAVVRGVADEGGLWREYELVNDIRRLRSKRAIENPSGLRPYLWRRRAGKLGLTKLWGQPASVVPAIPAGPAVQPLSSGGQMRRTAVDPLWGPPA